MLGFLPNSYCKPGNFKYWRSAEAESGETGYFNSALSTERAGATVNAQLTIYLRLLLVKRGKESPAPVDGNGKKFAHRNWDAGSAEFEKYRPEVKRLAEKFWDQTGFCVLPPLEYRGLDWPHGNPLLHLNVDCHFEIVWTAIVWIQTRTRTSVRTLPGTVAAGRISISKILLARVRPVPQMG
jgi:hypothetical protein